MARKINDAIAVSLCHGQYTDTPGKSGELSFSGDDEILRALGRNTIQESSESRFTASIYGAHSGAAITTGANMGEDS